MNSTKTVELRYDTGVRDSSYAHGSIGELNGFNKIESPLPESIEDIVNLIKEKSTKEWKIWITIILELQHIIHN